MSLSYVCRGCRLRASLRAVSRTALCPRQWLTQSARRAQYPAEDASTQARFRGSGTVNQVPEGLPRGRYSGRPLDPHNLLDELVHEPPASRAHRIRENPSKSHKDKRLVDRPFDRLDNSSRRKGYGRPDAVPLELWQDYQSFIHTSNTSGRSFNDREAVMQLLQMSRTPHLKGLKIIYRWSVFQQRCYNLVLRSCEAFRHNLVEPPQSKWDGPSPVEALSAATACRVFNRGIHATALWQVATAVAETQARKPEGYKERLPAAVRELMALWSLCMRASQVQAGSFGPVDSNDLDWSFLQDVVNDTAYLRRHITRENADSPSFERRLSCFVPGPRLVRTRKEDEGSQHLEGFRYAAPALVSLEILYQMRMEDNGSEIALDYEPWRTFMDKTFINSRDETIPLALAQQLKDPVVSEYYRGLVDRFGLLQTAASSNMEESAAASVAKDAASPTAPDPAVEEISLQQSEQLPQSEPNSKTEAYDVTYQFVGKCIKRLGRAVEQENITAAERVLKETRNFSKRQNNLQLPPELYESLLYSFVSLRDRQHISPIWNDMLKAEHQPTTKTYSILMRAAQNARDVHALEGFWTKMRGAGLKPDNHAWSTRVFGLMRSRGHQNAGFQAMSEMGQEWLAAARQSYDQENAAADRNKAQKKSEPVPVSQLLRQYEGDVDGVPRPSVAVMNSAVSALANRDDSLIPKVLTWGRTFGIEANLTTYNALINISMRRGLTGEALNILRTMNERGVETNSTTWTVLFTAMFESGVMNDLSPEQLDERVMGIIEDIDKEEKSGLDEKGYALIMDRLLKVYNNPTAAQRVLEHMSSRGIRPNNELYTILMTSHFAQSPPNLDAAEALWTRIKSENANYGAVLDSTFFDRMIEAYAQNHDLVGTQPMFRYMAEMERQGKRPSWRALETMTRALVEAEDWERAQHLVERARREREGGDGEKQGYGQREFWKFVEEAGLSRGPSRMSYN